MEITKIIGIGIVGTVLCVLVKGYRPEMAIGVAISVGLAIFGIVLPKLSELIGEIYDVSKISGIESGYFKTVVKIVGISYISQFASDIAKDANQTAIARKIELGGKVFILVVIMPVVKNLLNVIMDTLGSF